MKIEGWWFENKQNTEAIRQPKWFTPRTHFSVYLESNEILFPLKISVRADKAGDELFSREYEIHGLHDTAEYEILKKGNAVLFKGFADGVQGLPNRLSASVVCGMKTGTVTVSLSYVTIRGKTTDFQGKPFPSAVVLQRKLFGGKTPSIGVWSDENGEYSVVVPTGEYGSFYVDDSSYNSTTLENWSWNMRVFCDQTHDFKIGNGEVYGLLVEEEENGLTVSFRPMVMPSVKREEKEILIGGEPYLWVDIQPDISQKDLQIWIDGKTVPMLTIEKDYEILFDGERKIALTIYKVKIKKFEWLKGGETLVLEYQTRGKYETCAQGRTQLPIVLNK